MRLNVWLPFVTSDRGTHSRKRYHMSDLLNADITGAIDRCCRSVAARLCREAPLSAIGTKRTSACALHMSANDPKRTSPSALHMSAFDPKRTWRKNLLSEAR